jgi:hypothetical protein
VNRINRTSNRNPTPGAAIRLAICGVLAIGPAAALADRGGGSIRGAARGPEVRAPEVRAPVRVEPARVEPPRVEVRHDDHAPPPPPPARVVVPARRDWDDHDADLRHAGGFAGRAPVRIAFGQRFHDLPHHVVLNYDHRVFICDDDGNYYEQQGADYVVVTPPVGLVVSELPPDAITITVGPTTYYDVDGLFYIAAPGGFAVVNPPPGVVVPQLPTGATQVVVNNNVCYQFNGFYYSPSVQDGVTVYTVTPA